MIAHATRKVSKSDLNTESCSSGAVPVFVFEREARVKYFVMIFESELYDI